MNILNNLINDLNLSDDYILTNFILAPDWYKVFYIPKRSGGVRMIAQPSADLKKIQYWCIDNLLKNIPIHSSAMAYREKINIKDNAGYHVGKKFILKTDLKDFFPSIKPADLFFYVKKHDINLTEFDFYILSHFLFWKSKNNSDLQLCIGAPSSPIISNIILFDIDTQLSNLCMNNNVTYTRYADDMTFSHDDPKVLDVIFEGLTEILRNCRTPKLFINDKKTRLIGCGRSKRVTGIVLTHEDKLSIGRTKRRRIKAMLHLYKNEKLTELQIPTLQGLLSFAKNIEPEFYAKLEIHFGHEIIIKLRKDFKRLTQ